MGDRKSRADCKTVFDNQLRIVSIRKEKFMNFIPLYNDWFFLQ